MLCLALPCAWASRAPRQQGSAAGLGRAKLSSRAQQLCLALRLGPQQGSARQQGSAQQQGSSAALPCLALRLGQQQGEARQIAAAAAPAIDRYPFDPRRSPSQGLGQGEKMNTGA